jgi:hypothetical protein
LVGSQRAGSAALIHRSEPSTRAGPLDVPYAAATSGSSPTAAARAGLKPSLAMLASFTYTSALAPSSTLPRM